MATYWILIDTAYGKDSKIAVVEFLSHPVRHTEDISFGITNK